MAGDEQESEAVDGISASRAGTGDETGTDGSFKPELDQAVASVWPSVGVSRETGGRLAHTYHYLHKVPTSFPP